MGQLPFIGYFGLGDKGHKNKKNCVKTTRRDVPLLLLLIGIHPISKGPWLIMWDMNPIKLGVSTFV